MADHAPRRRAGPRSAPATAVAAICLSCLVAALMPPALAPPAGAQVPDTLSPGPKTTNVTPNQPVLMTADRLRYDRDKRQVIATGNVEISQGDRVVLADRVVYDQNTKVVVATGNVSMTEPSGEIIFAKRVVLSDDLKNGVIENFRMLFPDNTKVAANGARRTGGVRSEMSKAVFSPCKVCRDDPDAAPLWQLKARKIIHRQDVKEVTYRDAWFEVYGVPVLYTPFMSHPDPTVRRKSGFLAPTFGSDSLLGYFVRTPYFWAVSEDKDLTITPMITSQERGQLQLTYRQRFENGAAILSGSFTRVRARNDLGNTIGGEENRGHFFGKVRWHLDDNWRAGVNGYWASDDTYLRRYSISSVDTLVTTAWVEGFHNRDYTSARMYHFQGLRREDDYRSTPIVFPFIEHLGYGKPQGKWGRLHYSGSILALNRLEGVNSRRMTGKVGWRLPHTLPSGIVVTATANLHGDLYWINALDRNATASRPEKFDGVVGRLYPQATVDVRYPWVREYGNVRQVIEPRVALVAAPTGLNTGKIPNEDSVDFEFDDANLFAANRFPGQDRIDDGVRLVYGIGTTFLGNRGGETEFFLGQSLRLVGGDIFKEGSGLKDDLSDLVGRVRIAPASYFNLVYRFRLGIEKFQAQRNEVSLYAGVPAFNVALNYFMFKTSQNTPEFPSREELSFNLASQITKRWSVFGGARWDLAAATGGLRAWSLGGQFKNECCTIQATFARSFYQDRDVQPSNRFIIRVVLKHLGEFATGG